MGTVRLRNTSSSVFVSAATSSCWMRRLMTLLTDCTAAHRLIPHSDAGHHAAGND